MKLLEISISQILNELETERLKEYELEKMSGAAEKVKGIFKNYGSSGSLILLKFVMEG